MDAKQLKCIELMILYPEKTQKEIANEIEVSEQTICAWKKNEEFQKELKAYFDNQWKEMAKYAQKRMAQLMDSANDSVALGASKYVMDSYGRGSPIKIESDNVMEYKIVVDD